MKMKLLKSTYFFMLFLLLSMFAYTQITYAQSTENEYVEKRINEVHGYINAQTARIHEISFQVDQKLEKIEKLEFKKKGYLLLQSQVNNSGETLEDIDSDLKVLTIQYDQLIAEIKSLKKNITVAEKELIYLQDRSQFRNEDPQNQNLLLFVYIVIGIVFTAIIWIGFLRYRRNKTKVPLYQKDRAEPQISAMIDSPAISQPRETINQKSSLIIYDFIAFHLTILLLGGLVIMPIIYFVSVFFGLLGMELSDLISNYSYKNLVFLSIASLLPSMIAYGNDLKFNLMRFFIGAGIVVYFGLKSYVQLKASVTLPLPIGGGIIGILVATLTGQLGLAIKRVYKSKRLQRLTLYIVATVIVMIMALGSLGYFLKWNVWNVNTAIALRDKIGVGQFAKGRGEVINVQSVGIGNQAALVQLESGKTIVVVSTQDDDGFYCQALTLQPEDRIDFKGRFYIRDRATEMVSASWNKYAYAGLKLHSAAGMIDSRARCGGNKKYAGSIEKLE